MRLMQVLTVWLEAWPRQVPLTMLQLLRGKVFLLGLLVVFRQQQRFVHLPKPESC